MPAKYYRKIDFAKYVGMTPGNLANYVRDVTVVITGKLVDASHKINKKFIADRKVLLKRKGETLNTKVKHIPANEVKDADLKEPQSRAGGSEEYAEMKIRREQAELKKKVLDAEVAELNYQKLIGSSLPTPIVQEVITMLTHTYSGEYKNQVDALLTEIGHSKKLPVKERARLKGKLIDIVNGINAKANEQAKANLENILKEYGKR